MQTTKRTVQRVEITVNLDALGEQCAALVLIDPKDPYKLGTAVVTIGSRRWAGSWRGRQAGLALIVDSHGMTFDDADRLEVLDQAIRSVIDGPEHDVHTARGL